MATTNGFVELLAGLLLTETESVLSPSFYFALNSN